ncbi:MFS transporter [Microbispora cellulosiformans]|uniref:MFS transporter n=1 Tax=Microbispora cellulosiformans TaxID=2614688 RepID=A0A5J5JZ07_9ACTN|nr:MFS transporter [Microbispora cellulosiformans]KAA9376071.1 MFS transporter [Microbispora cellulosiformans]
MGGARFHTRRIGLLVTGNLLGGIGVAGGFAVGGLLVERLGGTAFAGLGQAASVLGSAVAAVPLAGLAARSGRRRSLGVGYALAMTGAVLIITAAVVAQIVVLLAGLALFGVAQAVNLQTRYAAADGVPAATRARLMSLVMWATTIGSVAGPNLSEPGERTGRLLGLPALTGPYLFAVLSFALAAVAVLFLPRAARAPVPAGRAGAAAGDRGADGTSPGVDRASPGLNDTFSGAESADGVSPGTSPGSSPGAAPGGARAALGWALRHPVARLGVVLIAVAHAVMVMVMIMTPLHMQHHGMSLQLVGVVISLHVLGMYALSPLFGWLADRFGPVRVALAGMAMLAASVVLGFSAAALQAGSALTATALIVLGLGWSASMLSASVLLANTAPDRLRIPLQGATDAGMSYAGAVAAALAGPILAAGGFQAVNVAAAVILMPAVAVAAAALRARGEGGPRVSRPRDAAPAAERG